MGDSYQLYQNRREDRILEIQQPGAIEHVAVEQDMPEPRAVGGVAEGGPPFGLDVGAGFRV